VTDGLPPAFVDCLLDSALEPVLDAAAQRGEQAAKRKKNAGDATEVAKALLTVLTATAHGLIPTVMVSMTVSVDGLITDTLPLFSLVT